MFGEVVAEHWKRRRSTPRTLELSMSAMPSGNCSPDKVISEPCRPPWNPRLPGNRPRHEAACASGGIALLAAMADLESGRYDVALVLGAELERTVPGDLAADHMGVGRLGRT